MVEKKKKGGKNELSRVKDAVPKGLTLEQVLEHPAVKQLNQKLEEARQIMAGLPEAIGRAVAEAQRAGKIQPIPLISGPAVQLKTNNENVEFHRKGRIVQNGQEVAPEGPTQTDFVKDIGNRRAFGGCALPALPAPASKSPAPPAAPEPDAPPSDPATGN